MGATELYIRSEWSQESSDLLEHVSLRLKMKRKAGYTTWARESPSTDMIMDHHNFIN